MGSEDELIQVVERQLADAEEAYRREPSDANRRRIERCWAAVRGARGEGPEGFPWQTGRPEPPAA